MSTLREGNLLFTLLAFQLPHHYQHNKVISFFNLLKILQQAGPTMTLIFAWDIQVEEVLPR